MIIHGDFRDAIAGVESESVDMVLCDPPYGMGVQSGHRNQAHREIAGDKTLEWLDDFSDQIFRVSKNNTAHYVFCSFHHIDKFKHSLERNFKVKNILIWEKNNTSMGDLKGDFAPKYEMILFLHKGRRLINGKRDPNIMKFSKTGNKLHPTQKPVDLLEYLIEKFSAPGELVLDPFMGSGSTGVACENKGRKFLGIEIDREYFDIASERLNEIQ